MDNKRSGEIDWSRPPIGSGMVAQIWPIFAEVERMQRDKLKMEPEIRNISQWSKK